MEHWATAHTEEDEERKHLKLSPTAERLSELDFGLYRRGLPLGVFLVMRESLLRGLDSLVSKRLILENY